MSYNRRSQNLSALSLISPRRIYFLLVECTSQSTDGVKLKLLNPKRKKILTTSLAKKKKIT